MTITASYHYDMAFANRNIVNDASYMEFHTNDTKVATSSDDAAADYETKNMYVRY